MATSSLSQIVCSGGLFLSTSTKRFLFLLRNQGKTAGSWGIVGGKKESTDTTIIDALIREIKEEVDKTPVIKKIVPLELFTSNDQQFQYNTYVLLVDKEFIPTLNYEHSGYAWCSFDQWPKPLHQGLKLTLNSKINKVKLETICELF